MNENETHQAEVIHELVKETRRLETEAAAVADTVTKIKALMAMLGKHQDS